MLASITALLAVSCGRVNFDELGDGDAGNGDGNGVGVTCTPSPEVCDGVDNDCNLAVDEGCPCTPFDVTLPVGRGGANLGLAWSGTRYMIESSDATTCGIQSVEMDGTAGPYAALVPQSLGAYGPSIAWTGSSLIAPYHQSTVGHVMVLDKDLQPIAGPLEQSTYTPMREPYPAALGGHAVLFWSDDRSGSSQSYARELSADGTFETGETLIAPVYGSVFAAVGDRYYIVVDGLSLQLYVVTRTGELLSMTMLDQAAVANTTDSIAVRGDRVAVAWLQGNAFVASYQVFRLDGTPVMAAANVPQLNGKDIAHVYLAATSDGFFMTGNTNGGALEIGGMEISPDGAIIKPLSTIATITASAFGGLSTTASDHRRVIIVPQNTPLGLRVIATCP